MNAIKKSLVLFALTIAVLNPPIIFGQNSEFNSFQITTNIFLHGNGDGKTVSVEYYSYIADITTNGYVLLNILYEPKLGYYYWIANRLQHKDMPLEFVFERQKQFSEFWLIPNVGIIDGRYMQGLTIYSNKVANMQSVKKLVIDDLEKVDKGFPWPGMAVTKKIDLPLNVKTLGFDFFHIPMHAEPPPAPKTISILYENRIWTINIMSLTAEANRIALFELNSDFKLLKAVRSN